MTQRSTMRKKYLWAILLAMFLGLATMIALLKIDLNCENNVATPSTYEEAYAQAYDYYDKGEKRGFLTLYLWQSEKTKRCYQLAANRFSLALSMEPDHRDALTNRAAAYTVLEQYDKAIDDYLLVLEINSGDFYARLGIAQVYEKSGQLAQAAAKYEEALAFMRHSQYWLQFRPETIVQTEKRLENIRAALDKMNDQ